MVLTTTISTSTDLTTHRIGLGLAAIGRPAYITTGRSSDLGAPNKRTPEALLRRTHTLLNAAWAAGVRFLDVARSYGRAEEFLGTWLTAHPERRPRLTIGSKWGYEYTGNWSMAPAQHERKNHSLATFERQWQQTNDALRSTPNRYLIHSVTPESPALGDQPLLGRLRELASTGVTIGLSTSGAHQSAVTRTALALPDTPFSTVQATWNLLEQTAAPALQEAHSAGWSIVVKEALANGRLLSPIAGSAAADLQQKSGRLPDSFAIGVALAQPWADVVLSGATTPDQLQLNLQAVPLQLTHEELRSATVASDSYWVDRSRLPWT